MSAADTASTSAHQHQPETAKDTIISIIIAFALAFVFRGFVIEAFVIPTGSMAPTLMGAHMKFRSAESGYDWSVDPWQTGPRHDPSRYPSPQQDIRVNDPMSGQMIHQPRVPLHAGDRILVLKYLYMVAEPSRWDVIVFKNPTDPAVNYIKRLIGLPGEEVALVDGDVFVRPAGANLQGSGADAGGTGWSQTGWTIARKPLLQQRAVWQPVFDAAFAPPASGPERTPFAAAGESSGAWTIGGRAYRFEGAGRAELVFDATKARFTQPAYERWAMDDRYAYDQWGPTRPLQTKFPVSDLRLRAGVEARGEGLKIEVRLEARRHEFIASIADGTATLSMRPLAAGGVRGEARVLASSPVKPLRAGQVRNVEFWHVDQSLQLRLDGDLAVSAEYDWSPAERLRHATGLSVDEIMRRQQGQGRNILAEDSLYQQPAARWVLEGAPFTLHRVAIERDLHYQPSQYVRAGSDGRPQAAGPALATSPGAPLVLKSDEFFACGDNSPASLDGRLWDSVDPWIEEAFGPPPGIVPRDLLLGRAFFVYWPSLRYDAKVPVPDVGRMRFIW